MIKLDEEKSKHDGLAHEKWFWLPIVAEIAVAGERCSNIVHLQKRV